MVEKVRIRITLDQRMINSMLTETTGISAKNAADTALQRLRDTAPKKTGALGRSFRATTTKKGIVTKIVVSSSLPYATWQNDGTGPIYPVRAKVLRFEVGGVIVFAKKTKGVPATHFIDKVRNSLTFSDFLPK